MKNEKCVGKTLKGRCDTHMCGPVGVEKRKCWGAAFACGCCVLCVGRLGNGGGVLDPVRTPKVPYPVLPCCDGDLTAASKIALGA